MSATLRSSTHGHLARLARPLALAAALGLTGAPGAARAQSSADVAAARDLFKEGSRLVQEGKWDEARDRYERSLALKRAAITLYSLGVAEEHTGRFVDALESYRAFLAEPPTPATEPWIAPAKESVASLEKKVARIEIAITPATAPGLVVRVDGQVVPSLALDRPRLVNPGAHEVTATAKGFKPSRSVAMLAEGGRATVALTLEAAPEEHGAAPTTPLPQGPKPAHDQAAVVAAPDRTLPFALIGGGAPALAAGVIVGMIGVGEASDAPTSDGPEADGARTKMLVGDILGGAGIAAGGVGAVLLLLGGGTAKPAKVGGGPTVHGWIGGAGGGVRVRF